MQNTPPAAPGPRYGRRTNIDHQSETVCRILDAAATLFAENCYAGTRMDDIAARAGVNKATLYYHIGGKEKIYQVVLLRHFTELAEGMEQALATCTDPVEGLVRVVRLHAESFQADNRLPRTVAHEMAAGSVHMTPEILAAYARIHACTARFATAGAAAGRIRPVNVGTLQVLLAGSLLVNTINRQFREVLAPVLMEETMPTLPDMADFLEEIVRGFIALPGDASVS